MMAYRSAVHDTTGNTPARMMLGRDLKLPVDLCFGRPEEEPIESTSDYVTTLQENWKEFIIFLASTKASCQSV